MTIYTIRQHKVLFNHTQVVTYATSEYNELMDNAFTCNQRAQLAQGSDVEVNGVVYTDLVAFYNKYNWHSTPPKTKPKSKRWEFNNISRLIKDQCTWMDEHGVDLAGYVERYGSKDDPVHSGNGGEAIYAADKAELERLVAVSRS